MTEWDDELLGIFLTDAKNHLSDIDTDMLAIEAAGTNIDQELVDKVFRAAHSIKGGAGFFDLNRIRELSHKLESVLELIRSRQMPPTPDVVNVLLVSFDKLKEMVDNHQESNNVDIAEFVISLAGLTTSHLPHEEKQTICETLDIPLPNGRNVIGICHFDLDRAIKSGKKVYILEYDMIDDIQRAGKIPFDLFKELEENGLILGCVMDVDAVGTLDDDENSRMPFFVLYAIEKKASEIADLLQVGEDKIHEYHHE